MVKKRKRRNEIAGDLVPAFTIGGAAIGSSILGASLDSKLPAGTANPLLTTGTTLGRFTGPVAVIGATSITLKQLGRIKT